MLKYSPQKGFGCMCFAVAASVDFLNCLVFVWDAGMFHIVLNYVFALNLFMKTHSLSV